MAFLIRKGHFLWYHVRQRARASGILSSGTDVLLMETGDQLLLETGDGILL